MGGAIYWTAREFAVKPKWDGGAHPAVRDSIHNKALITYDGKIKPAFSAAQEAFKATPLYRDDPAAVVRAELSASGALFWRALLFLGAVGFVVALLALDAWCLRDIWRSFRPRGKGQVVELPTRRVA
jgi:beta-glucuronidase